MRSKEKCRSTYFINLITSNNQLMQRAIYKTHHHDAAFSYLAFRNLAVCVHSVSLVENAFKWLTNDWSKQWLTSWRIAYFKPLIWAKVVMKTVSTLLINYKLIHFSVFKLPCLYYLFYLGGFVSLSLEDHPIIEMLRPNCFTISD